MDPEASDEEVMRAYQQGDRQAFDLLVRRHKTAVFNFLFRLCGQRSRAEDLLQETWLRVVRMGPQWTASSSFLSWLYTIARNLGLDMVRKDKHRNPAGLAVVGEPAPIPSPEQLTHERRVGLLIEKVLMELPEEQREVFLLRECSGISFGEISQITQTPENTVKSRMRYALTALRRRLIELGIENEFAPAARRTV